MNRRQRKKKYKKGLLIIREFWRMVKQDLDRPSVIKLLDLKPIGFLPASPINIILPPEEE